MGGLRNNISDFREKKKKIINKTTLHDVTSRLQFCVKATSSSLGTVRRWCTLRNGMQNRPQVPAYQTRIFRRFLYLYIFFH